jgi:pimeloyl-ACP methyl ester carboxylesterase
MDFSSDGVCLHYELHGPEDGAPIVLVHGFASDYQLNWVGTRWQETLVGAGFRVIGLDCRGHGSSDKPHEVEAYRPRLMAADVVSLLDHLEVVSARYLGYSMGARIGLQVVVDHPRRIRRAVLGGLGGTHSLEGAEKIARAMRGGAPESDVAETFYKFASARPTNDLEALAACIIGTVAPVSDEQLKKIDVPILLVVGDRDELARNPDRLVELIPTARLMSIADRDHMSAVPARDFKDAALEFLEES